MKKLLLFSLILLTGHTTLWAQTDPLSQFFNQLFIPTLVAYDSITVSNDTGAAFSAVGAAQQHYFVNNKIDTLTMTTGGNVTDIYKGKTSSDYRYAEVAGYSTLQQDSTDKIAYELDVNYNDSIISYYQYSGNQFALFFQARPQLNATGNPTRIDIFADIGGGLTKIGDYRFFYKQGLMDSVFYTVSPTGLGDGYLKFYYSAGTPAVIQKIETFEDVNSNGEKDMIQQLLCKTNQLNQVYEVIELVADNNLNMVLTGALRYSKRKHSTVSLPMEARAKVSIFPNPVQQRLHIQADKKMYATYKIINIAGQVQLQGDFQPLLDVSELPAGTYHLLLDDYQAKTFIKE